MNKSNYEPNCWHYLTGDFFYRMHRPLRKVMPTLKNRIQDMFNYAG